MLSSRCLPGSARASGGMHVRDDIMIGHRHRSRQDLQPLLLPPPPSVWRSFPIEQNTREEQNDGGRESFCSKKVLCSLTPNVASRHAPSPHWSWWMPHVLWPRQLPHHHVYWSCVIVVNTSVWCNVATKHSYRRTHQVKGCPQNPPSAATCPPKVHHSHRVRPTPRAIAFSHP